MKTQPPNKLYRRFSRFVIAALTCQARLPVTIIVYSIVALLLLVHVSAQVYTSVLSQDITRLKQQRHERRETFNELTGDYVMLSSRARVARQCEELGMKEAIDGSFERYAVEKGTDWSPEPFQFTKTFAQVRDAYGFTLLRESRKPR